MPRARYFTLRVRRLSSRSWQWRLFSLRLRRLASDTPGLVPRWSRCPLALAAARWSNGCHQSGCASVRSSLSAARPGGVGILDTCPAMLPAIVNDCASWTASARRDSGLRRSRRDQNISLTTATARRRRLVVPSFTLSPLLPFPPPPPHPPPPPPPPTPTPSPPTPLPPLPTPHFYLLFFFFCRRHVDAGVSARRPL
jgi:hypothetical protein